MVEFVVVSQFMPEWKFDWSTSDNLFYEKWNQRKLRIYYEKLNCNVQKTGKIIIEKSGFEIKIFVQILFELSGKNLLSYLKQL